jgi:hypothetical protein
LLQSKIWFQSCWLYLTARGLAEPSLFLHTMTLTLSQSPSCTYVV